MVDDEVKLTKADLQWIVERLGALARVAGIDDVEVADWLRRRATKTVKPLIKKWDDMNPKP